MNKNIKFNPIKKVILPPKKNFSTEINSARKWLINKNQENISKFPKSSKAQQLIQEFQPKFIVQA